MNNLNHYENGFPVHTVIGEHDLKIRSILKNQLRPGDLFINTTWIGADDQLNSVLSQDFERLLLYSGIDWNVFPHSRYEAYKVLRYYPSKTVGNDISGYYFSFWLDFVYEHLDRYINFNTYDIKSGIKTYMCLNRKPHIHRQYFVSKLFTHGLEDKGYVSLGSQPDFPKVFDVPVPILLDSDIVDEQGDESAFGENPITNDITSIGHRDNWNNHFLNIVTETTNITNTFISEKTFKPITGKRPFIILGDNHTYDILHKWGIDTFDDILGNGYKHRSFDNRVEWCINVIETLSKDKHLDKLLLDLKPRLDRNLDNLKQAAILNRKDINNFYDIAPLRFNLI